MSVQIQLRRDTAANWASNDPVLAEGEVGLDLTNNEVRFGDGVSAWTTLTPVGASGGTGVVVINAQTGTTYTLVLDDAGKLVTLNNASPVALTVPTNASVAFPVGAVIAVAQLGAGLVSIAGASGVTINGVTPGDEDLAGQWATAALTKLATDTWLLSGGIA